MAKKISKEEFRSEREKFHELSGKGDLPFDPRIRSFVFEKGLVLELLSQPGTDFLRAYYGINAQGRPTLMLSAAAGNRYFDVSTYYVEWPTGLDSNGDPV
jgi:hypothetical protein